MGAGVAPTMFMKQVSRSVDGLDPPIVAAEAERSGEPEERPGHGLDPAFLCSTGW
jgi:hypothetical protein